MTKHRPEFTETVKPTPDAETIIALVRRVGFIVATSTTRPMLDVLAKTGLLEVKLIGRGKGREKMRQYVMKGKAE